MRFGTSSLLHPFLQRDRGELAESGLVMDFSLKKGICSGEWDRDPGESCVHSRGLSLLRACPELVCLFAEMLSSSPVACVQTSDAVLCLHCQTTQLRLQTLVLRNKAFRPGLKQLCQGLT